MPHGGRRFQFGPYELDAAEHRLTRAGEVLRTAPKLFDTLLLLIENHGHLISRAELLRRLWPDTHVEDVTLARNISDLRQLLGETPDNKYIETIPKRGYRFIAPVQIVSVNSNSQSTPQPRIVLTKVAVLPFVSYGTDEEDGCIGQALAEEILHALTELPSLSVMARGSSFHFAIPNNDIRRIGRELEVSTVVEGSFSRRGDYVVLAAQIVDATTGQVLFSHREEGTSSELLKLRARVIRAIVSHLAGSRSTSPHTEGTANLAAWRWYWQARHYQYQFTAPALKLSEEYFRRAIDADPDYAIAYTGLAENYNIAANLALGLPLDLLARARAAMSEARRLDANSGETYAADGVTTVMADYDWAGAERKFRKALELNPSSSTAHHLISFWFFRPQRLLQEALDENEAALRLDPRSSFLRVIQGYLHYLLGAPAAALDFCHEALSLNKEEHLAYQVIGRVLASQARWHDAIDAHKKAVSLSANAPMSRAWLVAAYAGAGEACEAEALLADLEQLCGSQYVPATIFATVHLGLSNVKEAAVYFERALQQRDPALLSLTTDPMYREVVRTSRVRPLLSAMRLD
jgi:DNA-binding winged helix-turn-helix (wHTH) protein/Tfp pilus assembly protein PilF